MCAKSSCPRDDAARWREPGRRLALPSPRQCESRSRDRGRYRSRWNDFRRPRDDDGTRQPCGPRCSQGRRSSGRVVCPGGGDSGRASVLRHQTTPTRRRSRRGPRSSDARLRDGRDGGRSNAHGGNVHRASSARRRVGLESVEQRPAVRRWRSGCCRPQEQGRRRRTWLSTRSGQVQDEDARFEAIQEAASRIVAAMTWVNDAATRTSRAVAASQRRVAATSVSLGRDRARGDRRGTTAPLPRASKRARSRSGRPRRGEGDREIGCPRGAPEWSRGGDVPSARGRNRGRSRARSPCEHAWDVDAVLRCRRDRVAKLPAGASPRVRT